MKKLWSTPVFETLDVQETACGPNMAYNPNKPVKPSTKPHNQNNHHFKPNNQFIPYPNPFQPPCGGNNMGGSQDTEDEEELLS